MLGWSTLADVGGFEIYSFWQNIGAEQVWEGRKEAAREGEKEGEREDTGQAVS